MVVRGTRDGGIAGAGGGGWYSLILYTHSYWKVVVSRVAKRLILSGIPIFNGKMSESYIWLIL